MGMGVVPGAAVATILVGVGAFAGGVVIGATDDVGTELAVGIGIVVGTELVVGTGVGEGVVGGLVVGVNWKDMLMLMESISISIKSRYRLKKGQQHTEKIVPVSKTTKKENRHEVLTTSVWYKDFDSEIALHFFGRQIIFQHSTSTSAKFCSDVGPSSNVCHE